MYKLSSPFPSLFGGDRGSRSFRQPASVHRSFITLRPQEGSVLAPLKRVPNRSIYSYQCPGERSKLWRLNSTWR